MTHYELTQAATRICGHGPGTCCGCARKTPSPAIAAYLARRGRVRAGIEYNKPYSGGDVRWLIGCRWVEQPGNGMREVGKAHELSRKHNDVSVRIDHKGWYLDNGHNETTCGIVYQLPSRGGKLLFVPAVADTWSGGDGALCDFGDIKDNLDDAVRASDRLAELYAEDARDGDAKSLAEQQIEGLTEEIETAGQELGELLAGMRGETFPDMVSAALRQQVADKKRRICKLAKRRKELRENYWLAVA